MYKELFTLILAVFFVFAPINPASAITGGQPDGDGHPYSALLLVPGYIFCSGTLIAPDVILTAGHCTSFFTDQANYITEVSVTFDSVAAVNESTWEITDGNWYPAHKWITYPGYNFADWPFTADYGLVFLDDPVSITPAALPDEGLLDELIGTTGQTRERFYDVGYGQDGVIVGGGTYFPNFDFIRKVSEQRYNPSKGRVGTLDPSWLILGDVPSANHGAGCGGDSGSGIFLDPSGDFKDTVVAVHTGGYTLGYHNFLCGRITGLSHRVDIPEVLDWITDNLP